MSFSIFLGLLVLLPAIFAQTFSTTTLEPIADGTLYGENQLRANGAGERLFSGLIARNNNENKRRMLLKFDVQGIPSNAFVQSAVLTVFPDLARSGNPPAGGIVFTAHRITTDWGEGSSVAAGNLKQGLGTTPAANDTTWIHSFYPNVQWNNSGGDFEAVQSGQGLFTQQGLAFEINGTFMKYDVQDWLSGASVQAGWMVLGDEGTIGSAARFVSKEDSDASKRPKLTVVWSTDLPQDTRPVESTTTAAPNVPTSTTGVILRATSLSASTSDTVLTRIASALQAYFGIDLSLIRVTEDTTKRATVNRARVEIFRAGTTPAEYDLTRLKTVALLTPQGSSALQTAYSNADLDSVTFVESSGDLNAIIDDSSDSGSDDTAEDVFNILSLAMVVVIIMIFSGMFILDLMKIGRSSLPPDSAAMVDINS